MVIISGGTQVFFFTFSCTLLIEIEMQFFRLFVKDLNSWLNNLVSMSEENKEVVSKLVKITALSLLFMAAEFLGGYLAHSIAIWSDAFHLLSDVLAYVISLAAVLLSEKKSPAYLTFGWMRAQTLGALFNVVVIYIVTIELFIEATHRMIRRDKVQQPVYMLITSIFGLICNLIILTILHRDPNGAHHGCSHHHDHKHIQEHSHGHRHPHDEKVRKESPLPLNQFTKQTQECSRNSKQKSCSHDHQHHNHDRKHKKSNSHQPHHSLSNEHHVDSCCSKKKTAICQIQKNSADSCSHSAKKKANLQQISMQDGLLASHESEQEMKGLISQGKMKNINLEAAYIHILTDIILSIGVIIAAMIIYIFVPQGVQWSPWHLADPLCTYLFSLLAIYSTWPILKESLIILLDGCDNPNLIQEMDLELRKIEEVKEIVDLKLWSINRGKYYACVRVRMQKGMGSQRVRRVFTLRGIECSVEAQQYKITLKE